MTLKSISVARYRAFKAEISLELRPLTLVFGYNSAGKSALLRLLPLLRDTVREQQGPLFLGSAAARGASFGDIKCRLTSAPHLSLTLASEQRTATYRIRDLQMERKQVLEELVWSEGGQQQQLLWTTRDHLYTWTSPEGTLDVSVEFAGLEARWPQRPTPLTPPGAEDLREVQWVDAVRERTPRRMPYGPRLSGAFAPNGDNAGSVLAYAALDQDPVYAEVQRFYHDHLGHHLSVEPVGDDFRILVAPTGTRGTRPPGSASDLVDTGEGLGQVLPVAVALARAAHSPRGGLVAVEQPELHLHPRLHEELAAWMCRLVRGPSRPRVVVETHSENLLLALMLAVVEGTLSPDDVVVYWVHQLDTGESRAERVTLSRDGVPVGLWPPDVFSEDARLATRLNRLRLQRGPR